MLKVKVYIGLDKGAMMEKFNPEHKAVIDEMLLDHPLIRAGKMFGYPAYYVGRKLCICLYELGVGIKVPQKTAEHLLNTDPNIIPFQPLGKPKMREWILINLDDSQGYRGYHSIFEEAIQYILKLQS